MALRDQWAETGKSLGGAFSGLGKTIGKSAKTTVGKVDDSLNNDDPNHTKNVGEENVYNDGTWRNTGKDLGHAFKNVGKSITASVRTGLDKVDSPSQTTDAEPDPNNTVDSNFSGDQQS